MVKKYLSKIVENIIKFFNEMSTCMSFSKHLVQSILAGKRVSNDDGEDDGSDGDGSSEGEVEGDLV